MDEIYVLGLGCISSIGNSAEEVWEAITNTDFNSNANKENPHDFKSNLDRSLRRRADRDSLLGSYVVNEACKDSRINLEDVDRKRIGTIFSSGHDSVDTNLEFADQVSDKDASLCSPQTFSNTVTNAALGYICMETGFKGVSTMFSACNSIPFTINLLDEDKADIIFAGYLEGYSKELFESIKEYGCLGYDQVTEAAVSILLSRRSFPTKTGYCSVKGYSEINLGIDPIIFRGEKEEDIGNRISRCIQNVVSAYGKDIGVVFSSGGNKDFNRIENHAIKEVLPNARLIENVKEIFGEIMGASLHVNLMLGALCLKKGFIPNTLLLEGELTEFKNILVNGYDDLGNYISVLISKVD